MRRGGRCLRGGPRSSRKEALLAVAAMFGSALSAALGGWDAALQTLVVCMALDYLSGVVVAGVFKRSDKSGDGALDSRARDINDAMKVAAAKAIAELVTPDKLCAEYIIPGALEPGVAEHVAKRVAEAAVTSGAVRR